MVVVGLISAVALALYGFLHGGYGRDTHSEWLKLSDELKKNGEPLYLADVKPAEIPNEQNFFAADVFSGLDADAPRDRLLQLAANPGNGLDVTVLLASATKGNGASLDAIAAALQQAGLVRRQTDFLLAGDRVRAGIRALGLDFTPLAAAADRPAARFPIDYARPFPRLPHLRYLEALGDWLAIHAVAQLSTGDADAASIDLLLIGRMADSLASEPFLPSQRTRRLLLGLFAGCVRVGILWDAWSDEQLARFGATLEKARLVTDLGWAVRGERAQLNSAINLALNGERPSASDELQGWLGTDLVSLDKRELRARQVAANRAMQDFLDGLSLSEGIQLPKTEVLPEKALSRFEALTEDARISAQLQTYLAQAELACGLERYRIAKGAYPGKPEELVPDTLAALPLDPMTGQPIRYATKDSTGYTLTGAGWADGQPWVWNR
ncbi:MAG TPA: hypothetical protein VIM61_14205 [Chthoniobacterales bacterium]